MKEQTGRDNDNIMTKKESTVSEIKQWVSEVKELHKHRISEDFNMIFDIHPVDNFEAMFLVKNKRTDNEVKEEFVNMFEKFCKRVIDTAEYESRSSRVSDELSSVSKTLYLMDFGYGVYSDIVGNFSKNEVKARFDVSEDVYRALDIIAGKRLAIARIVDPFDFVRIEMDHEAEKRSKDA